MGDWQNCLFTKEDRDNFEFTIAETTPTGSFSLGSYKLGVHAYRLGFGPPIPEGFWPPYDSPTVIPDSAKRRASKGDPRTTRIRTTMDEADPIKPKRCPQGGVSVGSASASNV
ncbi:hypothetical protein AHAS_Ahas11G0063900 [Arachis hypogaea]